MSGAYVDTLYDFRAFLERGGGTLGPKPLDPAARVAIVGAGAAGLMAGRLLARMGLRPVIYEADPDRIGGRIWSYRPPSCPQAIFELGAMRVPPAENVFALLASELGIEDAPFPDPGTVESLIGHGGGVHRWSAGSAPPALFRRIADDWARFVTKEVQPLAEMLANAEYESAGARWQRLLIEAPWEWSRISFRDALGRLFPDWSDEEIALFGTLGIGAGGFGALYGIAFSEIARLLVNGLEVDQRFFPGGLDTLTRGLHESEVEVEVAGGSARVSLARLGSVRMGAEVVAVSARNGAVSVAYEQDGRRASERFDAAIVTTPTTIDVAAGLADGDHRAVLGAAELGAVHELHMAASSKLFALTKTKFWKGGGPQYIGTDGLCRGVYCLDYPGTERGVVLASYTWEQASTRLEGLGAEERFELLMRSLDGVAPDFAHTLRAEMLELKHVDWQLEPNALGAFKLPLPGQDELTARLYFQFLSALRPDTDTGVYLAGDGVSFSGGWIEGALRTAVNAASAVVCRLGGGPAALHPASPLEQRRDRFSYG